MSSRDIAALSVVLGTPLLVNLYLQFERFQAIRDQDRRFRGGLEAEMLFRRWREEERRMADPGERALAERYGY